MKKRSIGQRFKEILTAWGGKKGAGGKVDYRYFADPHRFSTYTTEAQECHFCGEERPGYEGGFYTEGEEIEFVCEPCLTQGKLKDAEPGVTTNEGDLEELVAQLNRLYPLRPRDANEVEAEWLREVLEQQTPPIVTHQDMMWPAHCGDFVRYVKKARKGDFEALAEVYLFQCLHCGEYVVRWDGE